MQGRVYLLLAAVVKAGLEACAGALFFVFAGADDEWKVKPLVIGRVQAVEDGYLLRREAVKPGGRLLACRLRCERAGKSGLAYEVGVRPDEAKLLVKRRIIHGRT